MVAFGSFFLSIIILQNVKIPLRKYASAKKMEREREEKNDFNNSKHDAVIKMEISKLIRKYNNIFALYVHICPFFPARPFFFVLVFNTLNIYLC